MKSLTIHNLDDTLDSVIRERAQREGTSLNKMIKKLLTESLGVAKKRKRSDFSEFTGLWSKREFRNFEKAAQDFEKIDQQDW